MQKNSITKEDVLKALSTVDDPELHQDLVSLNMIRDVEVKDGHVSFCVVLTTPACPLKSKIKQDAYDAVTALNGVESVEISFDANSPGGGTTSGKIDLPIGNAIAVASGKGGVGKSTIAVNIAVLLAKSGARVGLLDADIYGPNIPTMMGVEKLPPPKNDKIVPAEAHGVKIMSIGFLVKPEQPLIWRGPMLHSTIRQFLTDVEWGELDYLVIDLPPGTGDAALSLAQSIPLSGGVFVTLPQKVSLDDARRSIEMFSQLDVKIYGIVENMSFLELPDGSTMDVFGAGGGEKLAKEMNVHYIGAVPMDAEVRTGGDNGKPVAITQPDSPIGKAFSNVTEDIIASICKAAVA